MRTSAPIADSKRINKSSGFFWEKPRRILGDVSLKFSTRYRHAARISNRSKFVLAIPITSLRLAPRTCFVNRQISLDGFAVWITTKPRWKIFFKANRHRYSNYTILNPFQALRESRNCLIIWKLSSQLKKETSRKINENKINEFRYSERYEIFKSNCTRDRHENGEWV